MSMQKKYRPWVSVITVTYNSADVLKDTLESIRLQRYPRVEHIVVDGASTDGTSELLARHGATSFRFTSEADRGIYHAMNKGLAMAEGDIVGFLSAGDLYAAPDSLGIVADAFLDTELDIVFGDLVYFDLGEPGRIVRTYKTGGFTPTHLTRGIMPPHMATFVSRDLLLEVEGFDESFKIAGDFDCMVKLFWNQKASYRYLPQVLVKMQRGGISNASFSNRWLITREMRQACRTHGLPTSWGKLLSRYPGKVWQSLRHGVHGRL